MIATLLGFGILLFSASGFSEDATALPEWELSAGVPLLAHSGETPPTWDFTALISAEARPRYAGAPSYRIQSLPLFDLRYQDIAFISAIEGIGVNILRSPTHRIGIALNYDAGRSPHDAPALTNLADIRAAPEAKIFVDYVMFPIVLRADLRQSIGGAPGLIADAAVYAPIFSSDQLVIFSGLSLTWASRRSMNAHFGVSAREALAAGLAPYETNAGLRSFGFGNDLTWTFTNHWLLNAALSIQTLAPDAYRSPIVQTRGEPAASVALGYTF